MLGVEPALKINIGRLFEFLVFFPFVRNADFDFSFMRVFVHLCTSPPFPFSSGDLHVSGHVPAIFEKSPKAFVCSFLLVRLGSLARASLFLQSLENNAGPCVSTMEGVHKNQEKERKQILEANSRSRATMHQSSHSGFSNDFF